MCSVPDFHQALCIHSVYTLQESSLWVVLSILQPRNLTLLTWLASEVTRPVWLQSPVLSPSLIRRELRWPVTQEEIPGWDCPHSTKLCASRIAWASGKATHAREVRLASLWWTGGACGWDCSLICHKSEGNQRAKTFHPLCWFCLLVHQMLPCFLCDKELATWLSLMHVSELLFSTDNEEE